MTAPLALARACDDERRRKGLTQAALARKVGSSQPSVCMALGAHPGRLGVLNRIADYLKVGEQSA